MNSIRFTVLGRPEPQGSIKYFMIAGKPRLTSDNPRLRNWRQQVGWCAMDACSRAGMASPWPSHVPVVLSVVFVFAKPNSAPKNRIWPTVRPDRDKLLRAVGDALTGIVYEDDSQVVDGPARKVYGSPERTEIIVEALS
jgi:Holliday junction resolvase RusA-like endonuclease